MRKTSGIFVLAIAALLAAGVAYSAEPVATVPAAPTDSLDALLNPAPTELAICTACVGPYTTSPGSGQASHWGFGGSCSDALTDLTNQTRAAARAYCLDLDDYGTCSFSVVTTAPCWWNSGYGLYQVDGYANFKCRVWTGGPGCIIP